MTSTTTGRAAFGRAPPEVVLALDAGQSGVRARVARAPERVAGGAPSGRTTPVELARGVRPLDAPGAVEEVVDLLGEAADAARASDGAREAAVAVAGVSLSGFAPGAAGAEALGRALLDRLALERVVLAHDAPCAHLGALGGQPGVVAAVGTGSVVLGLGADGEEARVDGAGHLLGDAGSAFAVGRRGLEEAMRAHDGRGAAEALRLRAVARFGPLDALPVALYGLPSPVAAIASFAPEVAAAARAGDATARAIWAEAADAIAASLLAAARRTHAPGAAVTVCLLGGAFAAEDLLRDPVRAAVSAAWPEARHLEPAGTALDGAEHLAVRGAAASAGGPFVSWTRSFSRA